VAWRRFWLLFTVAGLGLINNGDFGVAALGASIAALLWTTPDVPKRPGRLRLLGMVVAGLVTALSLVALLTLLRAGSLPQPERFADYARTYAVGGFALMPVPGVLGVHLLLYLTYVAAIAVATVRALRGAPNRVLTGMLAWAGVFGLGAGMYWVGRSHPDALKHEFAAWALALSLLTIAAVGELAAPRLRQTAIGAFVALFGFGVAACSLAQTPTPWSQIDRLGAPFVPTEEAPEPQPLAPPDDPETRRFVASIADGPSRFVVREGAPVAILDDGTPRGGRIWRRERLVLHRHRVDRHGRAGRSRSRRAARGGRQHGDPADEPRSQHLPGARQPRLPAADAGRSAPLRRGRGDLRQPTVAQRRRDRQVGPAQP